ncbi:MAG: hypothetical protein [Caudoviricetes sp.]|nr:MAG: hypothetical protein [Caudoviricetes sp.]
MSYQDLSEKGKLDVLRKKFRFNQLVRLDLDEGRVRRNFVKPKEVENVIYAIAIDDELKYIGKTKDLWKRMDTYRSSKYWKNANPSNVDKTEKLETAIKAGQKVELYIRKCVSINIDTEVGDILITTMHSEETRFIKQFKPLWNIQFGKI